MATDKARAAQTRLRSPQYKQTNIYKKWSRCVRTRRGEARRVCGAASAHVAPSHTTHISTVTRAATMNPATICA